MRKRFTYKVIIWYPDRSNQVKYCDKYRYDDGVLVLLWSSKEDNPVYCDTECFINLRSTTTVTIKPFVE